MRFRQRNLDETTLIVCICSFAYIIIIDICQLSVAWMELNDAITETSHLNYFINLCDYMVLYGHT